MNKCCTSHQTKRTQRRINGLQLPLNYLQVVGWIVFILTILLNIVILIQIQRDELKLASAIIFGILYTCHIFSHIAALLLDPSEEDLRKQDINTLPEFDRTIHAHVIENGRCHLCNINCSDKKTKHCGICNKCVYHFDHHCKWLNNCVGRRNYSAFIICVVSALLIALFTSVLCLTDIVLFIQNSQEFSFVAQHFINCTQTNYIVPHAQSKYCGNSIIFLIFLIMYCVCALTISCALLHLLCFHIYISILGISTYEYIMSNTKSKAHYNCCRTKIRKLYIINQNKVKLNEGIVSNREGTVQEFGNETSMKHVINTLINQEINKAKKIFLYENNKIHPVQDENT